MEKGEKVPRTNFVDTVTLEGAKYRQDIEICMLAFGL